MFTRNYLSIKHSSHSNLSASAPKWKLTYKTISNALIGIKACLVDQGFKIKSVNNIKNRESNLKVDSEPSDKKESSLSYLERKVPITP